MPGRDGTLKAREFLFFAEDHAMASLPPTFPRPERRVMWTILQLHWGNPAVHFELQPQPSRRVVELGLHFEGPVEANDAWAAHIGAHAADVLCALGPRWELEEWTASWRRLHRTYTFETLTRDLGREVGEELARALTALHPLIEQGPQIGVKA
ncbi:MAG: hypothetical protein IT303_15930 [Dehalococcoidia bacterium]|nr:hypothetical protein [Dehalococcoidia bacterium]